MSEHSERVIVAVLAGLALAFALWSFVGRGFLGPVEIPGGIPPEEAPPPPDTTDGCTMDYLGQSPLPYEDGTPGPALYTANVVDFRPPLPPRPAVVA